MEASVRRRAVRDPRARKFMAQIFGAVYKQTGTRGEGNDLGINTATE